MYPTFKNQETVMQKDMIIWIHIQESGNKDIVMQKDEEDMIVYIYNQESINKNNHAKR